MLYMRDLKKKKGAVTESHIDQKKETILNQFTVLNQGRKSLLQNLSCLLHFAIHTYRLIGVNFSLFSKLPACSSLKSGLSISSPPLQPSDKDLDSGFQMTALSQPKISPSPSRQLGKQLRTLQMFPTTQADEYTIEWFSQSSLDSQFSFASCKQFLRLSK